MSYPFTRRTVIRISRTTHEQLRRLAKSRHQTVCETVRHAATLLIQDEIGHDLAVPLTGEEVAWLDTDAG